MPGKIKSKKQLKFLRAAAEGALKGSAGPSPETAKKMISHESHETKSRLMRGRS